MFLLLPPLVPLNVSWAVDLTNSACARAKKKSFQSNSSNNQQATVETFQLLPSILISLYEVKFVLVSFYFPI